MTIHWWKHNYEYDIPFLRIDPAKSNILVSFLFVDAEIEKSSYDLLACEYIYLCTVAASRFVNIFGICCLGFFVILMYKTLILDTSFFQQQNRLKKNQNYTVIAYCSYRMWKSFRLSNTDTPCHTVHKYVIYNLCKLHICPVCHIPAIRTGL